MIQDPNPTDLPEVEAFIDWLYSPKADHISHNFNAEQLTEAMRLGIGCLTSRDGGSGSMLYNLIERAKRKLKEIEDNPIHQAKAATIFANAPKALIQQGLSAQAQVIREIFGSHVDAVSSKEGYLSKTQDAFINQKRSLSHDSRKNEEPQ